MEAKLFIFAAVAISEVFSGCKPTQTRFENFMEFPRRSVRFVIGITAKKCPGLKEYYYRWTVTRLHDFKVVQKSLEANLPIEGYNYDSNFCFRTKYLVRVQVSHYPDMRLADETSKTFEFVPDQMHIEIVGGSEKTHGLGADLVLDARTLSRDRSYPPKEDAFHGNSVTWSVFPEIKGFSPPPTLVIRVPQKFFKLNMVVQFEVFVSRTKIEQFKDKQSAIQVVKIVSPFAPEIFVRCIRNCIMPHNLEPVAFTAGCVRNCENIKYFWTLEPDPSPGKVNFGTGYDKLVVLEKAYNPGQNVSVILKNGEARVVKTLTFVSGLIIGTCNVFPPDGISLITKFTIKCTGFNSPYGIANYMIYQFYDKGIVLIHETTDSENNEVTLGFGDPAILLIVVQDNAFLQKTVVLSVEVRKYSAQKNLPLAAEIKNLVLNANDKSILTHSLERFNNEVVQLGSAIVGAMKAINMDKPTARDLHKHMAEAVFRSHSTRFSSNIQRLTILIKLQQYKFPEDTITSELIGRAMKKNSISTHLMYIHKKFRIPQHHLNQFFADHLILAGQLMRENPIIKSILDGVTEPHYYDSYDDFEQTKIQIRQDFTHLITDVTLTVQINCITILYKALPDQSPNVFHSEFVSIVMRRVLISSITTFPLLIYIDEVGSSAALPRDLLEDISQKSDYVDIQLGIIRGNPFWWHADNKSFNTEFIFFDLFLKCDRIKTYSTPISVKLRSLSVPKGELADTLTNASIASYRLEIEPHSLLLAQFDIIENTPIEREMFSDDYYYDNQTGEPFLLASWSECPCEDDDFYSSRTKLMETNMSMEERYLRIMSGDTPLTLYICVKKLLSTLSFRMTWSTFACVSWDIAIQDWNTQACKPHVKGLQHNTSIICECTTTSLVVGKIKAPMSFQLHNADFNFDIDKMENYVAVFVVGGLVFLWLFFLLLAHHVDKSMKKENVIYKLDDNVPGDRHAYLTVVFTGCFFDAQTTADVAIQLIGNKGKSRVHLIKCHGITLLKRNSQDWFIIYTPYYLGRIKRIKIFHNLKGKYPHWYCDRVIVQDLKTAEQYCFTVKKWFSVIWGSGKYYRVIDLKTDAKKIPKFLFKTHFENDMRNKNGWMSIWARDTQSNFNSKERVSVGFCILFLSMLANGLIFRLPTGGPIDSIDEPSSFEITLANIVIFIESWLVATVMGIFLIFLFRNSAPN